MLSVTCETCHGDVTQMTVAEPQRGQNMGWCLGCHQKMSTPEDFVAFRIVPPVITNQGGSMTEKNLSRRDFLKISGLGVTASSRFNRLWSFLPLRDQTGIRKYA